MSNKPNRRQTRSAIRKGAKNVLYQDLGFTAKEQYKLLRANLMFTLADEDHSHVVGVTSPMRAEGKSTTSINLACSLAEAGKKVILIDCDLRLPTIAKRMELLGTNGLSQMLLGFDENEEPPYVKIPDFDNLYVLTAGSPLPPNPSELLSSARMQVVLEYFKKHFDYIILDLPPVNVVSDAIAVSPYISGMVLVIREGITQKKNLSTCVRQLKMSETKILGAVLNSSHKGKVSLKKSYYYYNYEK